MVFTGKYRGKNRVPSKTLKHAEHYDIHDQPHVCSGNGDLVACCKWLVSLIALLHRAHFWCSPVLLSQVFFCWTKSKIWYEMWIHLSLPKRISSYVSQNGWRRNLPFSFHVSQIGKKYCKWYTHYFSANFWMPAKVTDVKFPYVTHSNFTTDKTDMLASGGLTSLYNL